MGFWGRLDSLIRTKDSAFQHNEAEGKKWGNEDLDQTPPSSRTWRHWNYFAFFWAVAFNPISWNSGSSMINLGLLWWQATLAAIVSCMIMSTLLVLNSRGAAIYHVGYPVYVRICAGLMGSLVFVFIRGIVAVFFFGVQSLYAAKLVEVMLRCVFADNWTNIPNHLPNSAGITTAGIAAFFMFWFVQLAFMLLHPEKSRWLYTIKSFICPPVLLATFAFIVGKTGGLGETHRLGTAATSSSVTGWAFMTGINSVAGSLMTEVSSNPDLARYAKTAAATAWPQWIGLTVAKSCCIFLGIGASSAVKTLWGTAFWNIWDLYGAILDHYWNGGSRAAVFLACLIQALAVVATNLAANALPVGSDLTGLFPRYFNIVRGQVLCAVLGIVVCPWLLVSTAAGFLTFLGSNLIFLSPLVSIMITDYYIIRKGNVHVPSLYRGAKESPYWYYGGFNLRAFAAWLIAVVSVIHGLAGSFHTNYNKGSTHIYSIGMLLTLAIAGSLYYLFNLIWPVDVYPPGRSDEPRTRECLATTDGFFADEVIVGIGSEQQSEDDVIRQSIVASKA